jgi:hypothetical protein
MSTKESASRLREAIDEAMELFQGVDDARTTEPSRPGGWCAREVVGHLIDSACNNHRRFVTGLLPQTTRFDGYEQDAWVSHQHYAREPWPDLVTLWAAYNRHLAHLMASTPDAAAARALPAPSGSGEVTIAFLMDDYVVHLRHHLAQLQTLLT